jgi:hypothetical protein
MQALGQALRSKATMETWERGFKVAQVVGLVTGATLGGAFGGYHGYAKFEGEGPASKYASGVFLGCTGMVLGSMFGYTSGIVAAGVPIWGVPVIAGIAFAKYKNHD